MPGYSDILVAIHGIGAQQRSATVRSVATRFAGSEALRPGAFAPQPLGYFHTDVREAVKVAPLARTGLSGRLAEIGFAEVFWADIPQEVVDEGRTLEEIKAWGQTIVARARATCQKARAKDGSIARPDFTLAAEVIDEIIETIQVLENLSWIAEKAGIGRFDMRELLDEYVGDVQVVAEFTLFRRDILGRFHAAMQKIHEQHPGARLHIVAHSEGTVVAFLGLIHALAGRIFAVSDAEREAEDRDRLIAALKKMGLAVAMPPESENGLAELKDTSAGSNGKLPAWLGQIHGLMTLGSPIDKHLLLWEDLAPIKSAERPDGLDITQAAHLFQRHRIRWRNYYDRGDPVGFELDTARRWLVKAGDRAFEFCGCSRCRHDIGFSRYMLPGKAHNDYWDDPDVFDHFIRDVVLRPDAPPGPSPFAPPRNKWGPQRVSPCVPYAIAAVLLGVGTYFLYKEVTQYTHPQYDLLRRYVEYALVGFPEVNGQPAKAATGFLLLRCSLGLATLIGGVTIAARLPRLALGMWRRAVIAWSVGALGYCLLVPGDSRGAIGAPLGFATPLGGTVAVLVAAFVVAAIGLSGTARPRQRGFAGVMERRQRWLRRGARPLIFVGSLAIAGFVAMQALRAPKPKIPLGKIPEEKFGDVVEMLSVPTDLWPVLLAGAAFLYLWWLATLIFDLAFVWNRYIRGGLALQRLRDWDPLDLPDESREVCRYRDESAPPAAQNEPPPAVG